jgi:hypothetical protein
VLPFIYDRVGFCSDHAFSQFTYTVNDSATDCPTSGGLLRETRPRDSAASYLTAWFSMRMIAPLFDEVSYAPSDTRAQAAIILKRGEARYEHTMVTA